MLSTERMRRFARMARAAPRCAPSDVAAPSLVRLTRNRCTAAITSATFSADSAVRAAAAGHALCGGALKLRLRSDPDPVVRAAVADPVTLTHDPDPRMRVAATAATDPATIGRVLYILGWHSDYLARSAVAGHPDTDARLLARLATDHNRSVRFAAASNPNTGPAQLLKLASDHDLAVRSAVGSNPSITPEVVDVLVAEPGNPVSETLAANPSCPPHVLILLGTRDCLHDDTTTQGCTCRYDGEAFEVVLSSVLTNPSAPPQLRSDLRGLWAEMHPEVIPPQNPPNDWQCDNTDTEPDSPGVEAACGFALAETDPDTQMLWARHRCDEVRRDLALNERLTLRTAEALTRDADPDVLRNLLTNTACPPDVLRTHATERRFRDVARNPNCPPQTLTELAAIANSDLQASVGANPNCPPQTLTELAAHSHVYVREAVLTNPSAVAETVAAAVSAAVADDERVSAAAITAATLRLRRRPS